MTRFENELKNNNFVCGECLKCKKIVWPPSEFCNICLGNVSWRKIIREAVLLEYAHKNGECFCVAEMEGQIRIIGTILEPLELKIGQRLYLEKCDYDNTEKYFFRIQK